MEPVETGVVAGWFGIGTVEVDMVALPGEPVFQMEYEEQGTGEVDTGDGTSYYTLVEWQDAIASCLSSPKSFG